MIVNVVLHLITLFTKNAETASILFSNQKILAYIFSKLKEPEKGRGLINVFNKAASTNLLPEKHF